MSTSASRVRWTKKALQRVLPGPDNLPASRTPVAPRIALEEIGRLAPDAAERWKAGLVREDGPVRELVSRVLSSYEEPERFPLDRLDLNLEVARAAMLDLEWEGIWDPELMGASGGDSLGDRQQAIDLALDLWQETMGLDFALEVIVRARDFWRFSERKYSHGAPNPLWLAPRPDRRTARYSFEPLWIAMRARLSAALRPVYDLALEVGERMRPSLDDEARALLSFAFPAEQRLCREDAERAVQKELSSGTRVPWLLASLCDARLCLAITPWCYYPDEALIYTLVHNLGASAAPVVAALYERNHARTKKACVAALSLIESPEVVRFFVDHLSERPVTATATSYLERLSPWAEPELELAADRSEAAAVLLEGLRARAEPRTESAPQSDGPPTLESVIEFLKVPPWEGGYRSRPLPVLRLDPIPVEPRISFVDREEVEGADEVYDVRMSFEHPSHVRELLLKQLEAGESGEYEPSALEFFDDAEASELWNRAPATFWRLKRPASVAGLLDRFGFDALPGLLHCARVSPGAVLPALQGVVSRDVALTVATAYVKSKTARPAARGWLARYANEASMSLIPEALGPKSSARDAALGALRFLFSAGYESMVRDQAARYGDEAARALRRALERDELLEKTRRCPALPPFWAPEAWRRPQLLEDQPLPRDAMDHLGEVLMLLSLDRPSPVIAQLKNVCTRDSLSSFAWDLFEAWRKVGNPRSEVWAFHALGHLGDDTVVPPLARMIRQWPLEGLPGYASTGLEVLAAIGSDAALHEISRVSQRFKSRGLKQRAATLVRQLAEVRGLTRDQLADRLVPDLGLDSDGVRVLDFGTRSFRVSFDEGLHPHVSTESGERLKELPAPGKRDDSQRAREAAETWKAMKKEARSLRTLERRRLEMALVGRRRWPPRDFRTCLVGHPILSLLARGLVWGQYDAGGSLIATFRVARDRQHLGQDGEGLPLPPDVLVGLPHPIEMSPIDVERWRRVFADFALIQPFSQLERPVIRRTAEQESLTAVDWVEGREVAATRVLGLEGRGWQREDEGRTSTLLIKRIPGTSLQAELPLDPGIFAMVSELPTQRLGRVVVGRRRRIAWRETEPLPLRELDEVAFSELASDLRWLEG